MYLVGKALCPVTWHASATGSVCICCSTGTEHGAATEERTSSGGADTGRQSQQMSDAPAVSEEGGRFDEEQQPGNHPYDPRPRYGRVTRKTCRLDLKLEHR
jgi:hypothetical protein